MSNEGPSLSSRGKMFQNKMGKNTKKDALQTLPHPVSGEGHSKDVGMDTMDALDWLLLLRKRSWSYLGAKHIGLHRSKTVF